MRMWKVNPKLMCRQHLLGEHLEQHMFATCIKRNRKLGGYISNGMLEPLHVKDRHDILVQEMERRGYNHKTPLETFKVEGYEAGHVDSENNLKILRERCIFCQCLQEKADE